MTDHFPKHLHRGVGDILRPAGLPADRIALFLLAMEDIYRWSHRVEIPTVSEPLRKLQQLAAEVERQVEALRESDPQAVDCIFSSGGNKDSLADAAEILKNSVQAVVASRQRPVGKQPTPPRIYRASLGVAMAFRLILNQRPTLTRGGDYEAVLSLVLEAVTGVERGEDQIHNIAKRVLKAPEFSMN